MPYPRTTSWGFCGSTETRAAQAAMQHCFPLELNVPKLSASTYKSTYEMEGAIVYSSLCLSVKKAQICTHTQKKTPPKPLSCCSDKEKS